MRVSHIATLNYGGAGIAARRLHEGLGAIGVSSEMIVMDSNRPSPTVKILRPDRSLAQRITSRFDRARYSREFKPYATSLTEQHEFFTDDRVPGRDLLSSSLEPAEVYNIHWVAGLVDHSRFFSGLPRHTPVVWTLHDMNPFTGGCHYTLGANSVICDRFTGQCGLCPKLGSQLNDDPSHRAHRRKVAALSGLDPATTRIVATSDWLKREAERSSILGRFQVNKIPYGLDTSIFQPRSKEFARQILDLPVDGKIVIFVADSVEDRRKGFDLLMAALAQINVSEDLTLVTIGAGRADAFAGHRVISLGRVDDERMLSLAYSAADVFVMPTRAEAFGQVVFEAMACGTPVVGFDVGGVSDMVRPLRTGLLVPAEDVRALREGILTVLSDGNLKAGMSRECRRVAVSEYGLELQARRYLSVYEELMAASANAKSPKPGQA